MCRSRMVSQVYPKTREQKFPYPEVASGGDIADFGSIGMSVLECHPSLKTLCVYVCVSFFYNRLIKLHPWKLMQHDGPKENTSRLHLTLAVWRRSNHIGPPLHVITSCACISGLEGGAMLTWEVPCVNFQYDTKSDHLEAVSWHLSCYRSHTLIVAWGWWWWW